MIKIFFVKLCEFLEFFSDKIYEMKQMKKKEENQNKKKLDT